MAIKKVKTKKGLQKWEVNLRFSGRGSKSIRRRFDKKLDAQEFINNFGSQILTNDVAPFVQNSKNLIFSDEASFWLENQKANNSISQLSRVKDIVTKLIPMIGNTSLTEFSPSYLYKLRNELMGPNGLKGRVGKVKNSSINRWMVVIKAIINFSYLNQRLIKNPCVGFKMLKEENAKIDFWTKEEAQKFLRFTKNKYLNSSKKRWVYSVYLLALNTGLRSGEIWGLQKDDFLRSGVLNVSRQWLSKANCFARTKSNKTRLAPLNKSLRNELEFLIKNYGVGFVHNTIFQSISGTPINHSNFRFRYFVKDIEEAEVRKIRFHDLRHTAFTLMVAGGIDIRTVQAIAGHSDIKTTMQYVHLVGQKIIDVSESFSITV